MRKDLHQNTQYRKQRLVIGYTNLWVRAMKGLKRISFLIRQYKTVQIFRTDSFCWAMNKMGTKTMDAKSKLVQESMYNEILQQKCNINI